MASTSQQTLALSETGALTLVPEEEPMLTDAGSGLSTTWAKGLTIHADGSVSGYYDVNKDWENDGNMCWAAAACNIIAWWQNYYQTINSASSTPPTDVEEIFDTLKLAWQNVGGSSSTAWDWWLSGYGSGDSDYIGTGSDGGYYDRFYTTSNVSSVSSYCWLGSDSALTAAEMLENALNMGFGITLSGAKNDGNGFYAGHAITLWGITRDEETGYLTSIHVTDSDDSRNGMFTIDLCYDEVSGYYLAVGDRFQYRYLRGFYVLRPFGTTDTTAPTKPTGLAYEEQEDQVVFSWNASQDTNGVYYEVYTGKRWIYTTETSVTVKRSEVGTYWGVYASDYMGNEVYKYGGDISLSTSAVAGPSLTMEEPDMTVLGEGKTQVKISWSGASGVTYVLKVDGKSVYNGTATSYTGTFGEGYHDYTMTATNKAGGSTSYGGSFLCDTINPTDPTNLSAVVQGNEVSFSWSASVDASRVSYLVYYRLEGSGDSWTIGCSPVESYSVELASEGEYEWMLLVRDAGKNYSDWVSGENFVYDTQGPEVSLHAPALSKSSEGQTLITFSWSCSEKATYVLVVDGKSYKVGEASSYSLTLGDGTHNYSVKATDRGGHIGSASGSVSCDATAPTAPSGLTIQQDKTYVTFSWQASQDISGVSYQFRYRAPGSSSYTTTEVFSGTSYSLTLSALGEYRWSVRAVDGKGNATSWVNGANLVYDGLGPELSLQKTTLTKLKEGQARVTFSWSCAETATFMLSIDGGAAFAVSGNSYTTTLSDGEHYYSLIATDAAGFSTQMESGPIVIDTKAPTLDIYEHKLEQIGVGQSRLTLSWTLNKDAVCTISFDGASPVVVTGNTLSTVLLDGTHRYVLAATDAAGNTTTVESGSFLVDATVPTSPSKLKVSLSNSGTSAVFTWAASSDVNAVSYELAYKASADKSYTYHKNLTINSLTLDLSKTSTYSWMVRAVDGAGNASSWVKGSNFNNDVVAPVITLSKPTQKKAGTKKAYVTFAWTCNEKASYVLSVDGKTVYRGSSTSRRLTLQEGSHRYSITATDLAGNRRSASGSLRVDTTVPTLPSTPKVSIQQQGKRLVFSWRASKDVSGVTYELAYKLSSAKSYTYKKNLTSNKLTLNVTKFSTYNWMVRAKDGAGNTTAWVKGRNFNNDVVAPVLTLPTPTQKKSGTKRALVTISWKSNERATYILKVDGKTIYKGSATYRRLTLTEGVHKYSITATDAAGNRRTSSSSLRVDTIAPTAPKSLKVAVSENGDVATFSWTASKDVSGVTYELGIKAAGATSYTYYRNIKTASYSLDLTESSSYSWSLRAKDGKGNVTSWVKGSSFRNELAQPEPETPEDTGCALDRELAVSSGSIAMPVENELAVPAAGVALELGADAERRQALQGISLA